MQPSPTSPAPQRVSICSEDPRGEAATGLLAAMCTELTQRYHRPPSPYLIEEALAPRAGFIVARLDGEPVGCGALRCIDDTTVEVKRMYVAPVARRGGVARQILAALEGLAADHAYTRIILETGIFQPEALALYDASGYRRIASYGCYIDNPEAVCFEKRLV